MKGYSFGVKYRIRLLPAVRTSGEFSLYFRSVRSSPMFWVILDD